MSEIESLQTEALAAIAAADAPDALEALRVSLLGKSGRLTAQLKSLGALPPEARKPAGEAINLAHLLLGHGGDLAWVEWIVLDEKMQGGADPDPWSWPGGEPSWQAQDVDSQIKALFDPTDRFPYPGQAL